MLILVVILGVMAGVARPRPARYGAPRAVPVVFAAATVQLASHPTAGTVHATLLGVSIALGVLWIALQRRHLASVMLAVGVALNVAVIAANGGMPVHSGALARVGRGDVDVTRGFSYKHVPMTDGTRLAWLGDRIPIPIQGNVISAGDVLMGVAICLWVADAVGAWCDERRSTGAVHREHRRGSGRKVV